jgi:hypothetical protein
VVKTHHHRNAQREIAILNVTYASRFCESQTVMAYVVPPTEMHRYRIDTSVQIVKQVPSMKKM